jgi:hypothetical protein
MSKKRKRVQPTKTFPLPLIILGGIVLIAAAWLFARQGNGGGGTPSIAVDQKKIEFGDQHFGTNLTFEIKVTNTGTGALRFKEQPYIEVVEGC